MMLSRIAESLYWMARQLERADNTARVLDINLIHMLEADEGLTEEMQWKPLLTIVGADDGYEALYPDGRVTVQRVIHLLTQDPRNSGSIHGSLRMARENARVVRDRISNAMWETLNDFWLKTDAHLQATLPPWRAAEFYDSIHREVATFFGLAQGTMMRGEAYGFASLGSLQERADMSTRILDARYHLLLPDPSMVGSPLDYYQWRALLKSLSGFDAYRRQYQSGIRPIDVVEFVILNPDFPRSLIYCINGMERALERVERKAETPVTIKQQALRRHLTGIGAGEILEQGLHEYLDAFLARLAEFGAALQADYFDAYLEDGQ